MSSIQSSIFRNSIYIWSNLCEYVVCHILSNCASLASLCPELIDNRMRVVFHVWLPVPKVRDNYRKTCMLQFDPYLTFNLVLSSKTINNLVGNSSRGVSDSAAWFFGYRWSYVTSLPKLTIFGDLENREAVVLILWKNWRNLWQKSLPSQGPFSLAHHLRFFSRKLTGRGVCFNF